MLAASALQAYLDGPRLLDGPVRYARAHPRHQRVTADLAAGDHVLAVHLRNYGLATRVMPDVPAFWWCRAWPAATSEQKLAVGWRCRRITEHRGTGLRISPLLEWVEWTDEFLHPAWREVGYDDSSWPAPAAVPVTALPAARSVPASVQLPTWPARKVKPAAVGVYRDTYTGYEPDDLSIQIALSDLAPRPGQDIDGVWQRYDLGRVRIGALELDVWTAAGGAVTVAYGEKLSQDGRVVPVLPLSLGPTRMVQRYAVPAGRRSNPCRALAAAGRGSAARR